MRFEGRHVTSFAYSRPVFIEPHTIRLRPRSDPTQRLIRFSVEVDPAPDGMSEGLDASGNPALWMWFSGLHENLTITTGFEVETLRTDPFGYILMPIGLRLPVTYEEHTAAVLAPCLSTSGIAEGVRALAEEVASAVDQEPLGFLSALTSRIYESCEVIIRDEGDPVPSDVTLRTTRGSCRDLVVLFVDCCRVAGIAARFVSGYQEGDPDQEERHLHAWAEAYVPGGGWRGYDPTQGLTVSDRHIALAAAPMSQGAAPTSGTFRGTEATSKMTNRIELEVR